MSDTEQHRLQKLLLNFTWWVTRKDVEENNIFEGGFLGLDNIGVFDRNTTLPEGMVLEQSDGTAWMGMFAAVMLAMALELARTDPVYERVQGESRQHLLIVTARQQAEHKVTRFLLGDRAARDSKRIGQHGLRQAGAGAQLEHGLPKGIVALTIGVPRHRRPLCLPREPPAPGKQCEATGKKFVTFWRLTSPSTLAILGGVGYARGGFTLSWRVWAMV